MKKYSLELYLFNLENKIYWCLEGLSKQRIQNSSNILRMLEVSQGQAFLHNYLFTNRREKMDCFISVEQFPDIDFLHQQMLHIQKQAVQKTMSNWVYLNKVKNLYCTGSTKY